MERMKPIFHKVSKATFVLALFIELTIVIVEKSEYIIQYEGIWFRLTFLLFGISLITTKHHWKEWLALFLFGIIGVISYKVTGRNEILRWLVFIWACKGKDIRKVLKFTFWYTLAGCAVIMLLSIVGIYGSIAQEAVYRTETAWGNGILEIRYSFGMGHPNAFHCMMLVLTWLGIYCYYNVIKWYGYLVIGAGHLVVFYFTDSKTGILMSTITMVLVAISLGEKTGNYIYRGGILLIVGVIAFSIYMAAYSKEVLNNNILYQLDSALSNRILNLYYNTTAHEGTLSTWSLWSNSRSTSYFDLGIVRMFYWYGIIPAGIYFISQCRLLWCGYKKRDYMMSVILICITIYSVFEAHFVSDYMGRNYILFFFGMCLKDMLGVKEE